MSETDTPAAHQSEQSFLDQHIVVTGAAGFIGSHLCERLVQTGAHVTGIDNFLTGRPENLAALADVPVFRLVEGDVTAAWQVFDRVDCIMHLASPASPVDYLTLPVETLITGAQGTLRGLEVAAAHQARFVLASTSEVYGDPHEHPQSEHYWGNVNPTGPRSVYDEAKRYAEALTAAFARQRGVNAGIARIFNTYGPRMRIDDGRAVPTFVRQALVGEPITVTGDGRQTRSLCYVSDTVTGLLAMAGCTHPGPVNLGNPHEIRIIDLVEEVRRACDSVSPLTYLPARVDDPQRRCPDIALARRALGWQPRISLHEGLARTVRAAANDCAAEANRLHAGVGSLR